MTDDDLCKARMNLTAIKKVDPYANEIVDTSSHVAFYTFNSDKNEWEKTDVEGAFFIYSRNAEPRNSIFINNRLNTMSFVEPITSELELQSQPPFLLYRNERSRIRGFWFYNSEECERISKLVAEIVQTNLQQQQFVRKDEFKQKSASTATGKETNKSGKDGNGSMDIFKMLSKAQEEYNNSQQKLQESTTDNNVMKFFAAAKGPVQPADGQLFQRILPNTLSVEQLEKQQRNRSPLDAAILKSTTQAATTTNTQKKLSQCMLHMQQLNTAMGDCHVTKPTITTNNNNNNNNHSVDIMDKYAGGNISLSNFINAATANLKADKQAAPVAPVATTPIPSVKNTAASDLKKSLLQSISQDSPLILPNKLNVTTPTNKPALMLPTMFEKTNNELPITPTTASAAAAASTLSANKLNNHLLMKAQQQQLILNPTQLVQAFNYLLENDDDFVLKLHEAYIKTVSKTLLQNYQ